MKKNQPPCGAPCGKHPAPDRAAITGALTDARCTPAEIAAFWDLYASGQTAAALRLLSCHRCKLVCALHEAQKPIDILDYLLYQLNQQPQNQ